LLVFSTQILPTCQLSTRIQLIPIKRKIFDSKTVSICCFASVAWFSLLAQTVLSNSCWTVWQQQTKNIFPFLKTLPAAIPLLFLKTLEIY